MNIVAALPLAIVLLPFVAGAQSAADGGVYTVAQAASGREVYQRECALCHGAELEGGEAGPALAGEAFRIAWTGRTLGELFALTRRTMPVTRPAGLPDNTYAELIAYLLNRNGYVPGARPLPAEPAVLSAIALPAPERGTPVALRARDDSGGETVEWLHHRGDPGSLNYSSLELINRDNVHELEVAWRWRSDNFGPVPWPNLQTTPLMANGVLYATAGIRRAVVAIDAGTGETLWMYRIDEGIRGENAPRKGPGRGVAYRREGDNETIFVISPGYHLIALDASSGRPRPSFGEAGIVDLKQNVDQDIDPDTTRIGASSPPLVIGDLVIVGSAFPAGGAPPTKEMPAGHVTAYDADTGERRWIFHTIPQPGEPGHETWKKDSWQYTGNVGVWAPMSADTERGLIYLPVEAPTGDFYGGHRPGNNLYSQSLVCLDAATGERVWHFQTVHHGIWDYDLPAPPVLIDIQVDGVEIPAVAQITKQGFTFVFDRRDGVPVWPIEERAVSISNVPNEISAATQPFPALPEIFEPQGVTPDSLNDLTPEIHAEARRIAAQYTLGPIYTPPSLHTEHNKGTLFAPAAAGGANWQGAVADPVEDILFVSSTSTVGAMGLISDPDRSNMQFVLHREEPAGPFGLPLSKPPWGRITAIDMRTGKKLWTVANGDTPEHVRNHEKLKGVSLPRTGHDDRAGLLVTKSLLFAGEGAGLYVATEGGSKFRAHDKRSGEILAEIDIGLRQSGVPMTYALDGRQYIVIAAGAPDRAGELVALALPR